MVTVGVVEVTESGLGGHVALDHVAGRDVKASGA